MELVDIYDKDGNPAGIVKDRSEPLAEGEYILAVGMWIVDKENRILYIGTAVALGILVVGLGAFLKRHYIKEEQVDESGETKEDC